METVEHITDEQKRDFVRDGYLHVRGAIPPRTLARARRAINHSIGAGFDRNDITKLNSQSFCAELCGDPRLLRLATTPTVWARIGALVGTGRTAKPQSCQIALRFPRPEGTPRRITGPHIDGYHTPDNGVPDDGTVRNFTLLLGVMLSDVAAPFSGNFTVWPGTHWRLERYFRTHGVHCLTGGDVSSLGLRLPKPIAITGNAGDIVLAHYQLAHTASPNLSGDIRYMCFFRLTVRSLATHRIASMLDIWRDWPALRSIVASQQRQGRGAAAA